MLQQAFARQILPGNEVEIRLLELFFWNDLLQQGSGSGYKYGRVLLHELVEPFETSRQILPGNEVEIRLLELFFWNDLLQQGSGSGYKYGRVLLHELVEPFETSRHIVRMRR